MASIEIRPINQNEKEEIIKLSKTLVDTYENKDADYYNQILENFKHGINDRIIDFKSIWYNGELSGYFHLGKKDETRMELYFLFVIEEFRKKGIGSHVIEHAIYHSFHKKRKLYIEVSKKNTYAIKFLTDFGFKTVNDGDKVKNFVVAFEVNPRAVK